VWGYWFDLHAALADPRHTEFCLRLYEAQPTESTGPRPIPAADLLVRAVRSVDVDDSTIRWHDFRGIGYDGSERAVSIASGVPATITLGVKAINVRLLERA
jgi:hypothetical protein